MKKWLLGIFGLSLLTTVCHAGEICIAQKEFDSGYSSSLQYSVKCKDETFQTRRILTTFLIPLPFHWGKVARKYLYRDMTERGFLEVAKLIPIKKRGDQFPIHIFEKGNSNSSFCSVVKYNIISGGMYHQETIFDVVIACEGFEGDTRFKAVTDKEVKKYMEENGYKKALEVDYRDSFNEVVNNDLRYNTTKVIEIFRTNE